MSNASYTDSNDKRNDKIMGLYYSFMLIESKIIKIAIEGNLHTSIASKFTGFVSDWLSAICKDK